MCLLLSVTWWCLNVKIADIKPVWFNSELGYGNSKPEPHQRNKCGDGSHKQPWRGQTKMGYTAGVAQMVDPTKQVVLYEPLNISLSHLIIQ